MYYECHITFSTDSPEEAKKAVEQLHWKYSSIDGDPSLGRGVRCYATRHFKHDVTITTVELNMHTTAKILSGDVTSQIAIPKIKILREKIELVLYDSVQGERFE